jgi:hypothetical protein
MNHDSTEDRDRAHCIELARTELARAVPQQAESISHHATGGR